MDSRQNSYSLFEVDTSSNGFQAKNYNSTSTPQKQTERIGNQGKKEQNFQPSYSDCSHISKKLSDEDEYQCQSTIKILNILEKYNQKIQLNNDSREYEIKSRPNEDIQRQKKLNLVKNYNQCGLYNKMMVNELIPHLQQKFRLIQKFNQDYFQVMQQNKCRKYVIIGIRAYKMTIQKIKQFRQIMDKYQSHQNEYFHAEARKKLLIFTYQIMFLIWNVTHLKQRQVRSEFEQSSKQIKQINLSRGEDISQAQYQVMGNKIIQNYQYQKIKQDLGMIKKYFNCKKFPITFRRLLFNQVDRIINIILGDDKNDLTVPKTVIKIGKVSVSPPNQPQYGQNMQNMNIKAAVEQRQIEEVPSPKYIFEQKSIKIQEMPSPPYISVVSPSTENLSVGIKKNQLQRQGNFHIYVLIVFFVLGLVALSK